jgi:hypothetical protein
LRVINTLSFFTVIRHAIKLTLPYFLNNLHRSGIRIRTAMRKDTFLASVARWKERC